MRLMHTHPRRLSLAALSVFALQFLPPLAGAAPSAQEQTLMTKVKVLWSANRQAIRTVQCDYFSDLNGANRHVRYARDGEMYYHASRVINHDGKFGIMSEVAWDGQRAANRHSFGLMNYGSSPENALTSSQTPDDIVGHFAERELGLVDDPENRCEFLGASETEYEGRPVVELRYKRVLDQDTVITRHGQDVGYWPVYQLRTDPGGGTIYELKDVKYARFESEGNELFYPVYAYRGAYGGTRYPQITKENGNHMTLVVDEKTLKINEPVPLSRFMITPWPSERVHEIDTDRWIERADPNWSAVGNVDFPWDKVAAGFEKAIAEQKSANAKVMAAAPRPQTAAATPLPKAAVATSGSLSEYLNLPLIAGVIFLAGSGYWFYRRRRAS
jgi:hypothetical protein